MSARDVYFCRLSLRQAITSVAIVMVGLCVVFSESQGVGSLDVSYSLIPICVVEITRLASLRPWVQFFVSVIVSPFLDLLLFRMRTYHHKITISNVEYLLVAFVVAIAITTFWIFIRWRLRKMACHDLLKGVKETDRL